MVSRHHGRPCLCAVICQVAGYSSRLMIFDRLKSQHSSKVLRMAKLEMNYYHLKKATPDFVVLVILATAVFIASWEAYKRLSPAILDFITYNYWFEGDSAIYYRMMSERSTILHGPTRNHPLFSLITFPVTYATRRFLNVSSETAVGFYLATVAALWIGALFVLLRALRLKRLDAIVFCIVGAMSAS